MNGRYPIFDFSIDLTLNKYIYEIDIYGYGLNKKAKLCSKYGLKVLNNKYIYSP